MDNRHFGSKEWIRQEGAHIGARVRALFRRAVSRPPEKEFLKTAAKDLTAALFAFVLSQGSFLFGSCPFGIALLCASDRYLPFLFIGCVVGAFFQKSVPPLLLIVLYALLAALSLFAFPARNAEPALPSSPGERRTRKTERKRSGTRGAGTVALRASCALIAAALPGVYTCAVESFSLHALFALLIGLVSAGVFSALFFGAARSAPAHYLYRKIGWAALLFSLVYASSSLTLFGFSPNLLLSAFLLLILAGRVDVLSMLALGLLLGAACGRSYVITLGLVGGVSSFFDKYSRRLAPWLGVLAGFAWSFYDRGSYAFLYVLPDLVGGALISLPVAVYRRRSKARPAEVEKEGEERDLAPAFLDLSRDADDLRKNLLSPTNEELQRVFDKITAQVCRNCAFRCFENDRRRASLLDEMERCAGGGKDAVRAGELPFCPKKQLLLGGVNGALSELLRKYRENDRLNVYADCLSGTAQILCDRAKSAKEDVEDDPDALSRFKAALDDLGVPYSSLSVRGARRPVYRATGVDEAAIFECVEPLRRVFFEKGLRVSVPLLNSAANGTTLTLRTLPALKTDAAFASLPKEGEKENGDAFLSFEGDDRFYALLCDGTGSGEEASKVSHAACGVVRDLLLCGATPETALSFLNSFLLAMNRECPCTVDLFTVDLINGEGGFYKCGACSSLTLRGDNVFKISYPCIPAGAAKELKAAPVKVRVKAGDRVVLCTDGMGQEIETAPWLTPLLNGSLGNTPAEIAEGMLALCALKNDDRTAVVIDILREE